jgi:hypothetical protein
MHVLKFESKAHAESVRAIVERLTQHAWKSYRVDGNNWRLRLAMPDDEHASEQDEEQSA